jgi:hypothetical protein
MKGVGSTVRYGHGMKIKYIYKHIYARSRTLVLQISVILLIYQGQPIPCNNAPTLLLAFFFITVLTFLKYAEGS